MTMKLFRGVVTYTRDYEVDPDDYESSDVAFMLEDEVDAIDNDPFLWTEHYDSQWKVDITDITDNAEESSSASRDRSPVSELDTDFSSYLKFLVVRHKADGLFMTRFDDHASAEGFFNNNCDDIRLYWMELIGITKSHGCRRLVYVNTFSDTTGV